MYGWLVAGQRPGKIYPLVLEAAKREREARAAAKADRLTLPRFVWGDDDPPVSERNVGKYIRAARTLMEVEGRELSKSAVGVLGLTWARINDLYQRALVDKRYTVCRQLIRDTMEMFGLVGAVKLQLVAPGDTSGAPAAGDTSHLPETALTEEQARAAWASLALAAVTRLRAEQAKSGGAPIAVRLPAGPANTSGDGNN